MAIKHNTPKIAIFEPMQTKLSTEVLNILSYSKEEAMRTGHLSITADHLLLGILRHKDNPACEALQALGIDIQEMKTWIEKGIFRPKCITFEESDRIGFSREAQNTLNLSIMEAGISNSTMISPAHLLLAICASSSSHGLEYLKNNKIDHSILKNWFKERDLLRTQNTGQPASGHPVSILSILSTPGKIPA